MDGVVEIITGRERRRRWSLQDKVRIVAETNEPGSMVRAVAARYGVCESLLFTWRRLAREGLLGLAPESPVFVPVQTLAPSGTAVTPVDEKVTLGTGTGVAVRWCTRPDRDRSGQRAAGPCGQRREPGRTAARAA